MDKFKFAKPPYHTDGMAVYDATNPEARKYYWQSDGSRPCSTLAWTPGGWTRPNPKPKARKKISCCTTNSPSAAAIAM